MTLFENIMFILLFLAVLSIPLIALLQVIEDSKVLKELEKRNNLKKETKEI